MPVVRSLPDHAGDETVILETVTTQPGLHISEIAVATRLTPYTVRRELTRLVDAKLVVITGSGRGQRVTAAGRAVVVPTAPAPARPSTPAAVSSSTDLVNSRDTAIAAAVKRSKGPAAFTMLMDAMPTEKWESAQAKQEALSNVLRRLRAKQIIQQVDGGWAAA